MGEEQRISAIICQRGRTGTQEQKRGVSSEVADRSKGGAKAMTRHEHAFVVQGNSTGYYAVCECGWKGPVSYAKATARSDGKKHCDGWTLGQKVVRKT